MPWTDVATFCVSCTDWPPLVILSLVPATEDASSGHRIGLTKVTRVRLDYVTILNRIFKLFWQFK